MTLIFLIYGFSFLILGMAIVIYPRRESALLLGRNLGLLAGFALLHGTNEWIDMFLLGLTPQEAPVLTMARTVLLPLSFLFLLQFGAELIAQTRPGRRLVRRLPAALLLLYFVLLLAEGPTPVAAEIWARYLFCVPGTLLAAWALLLQIPSFWAEGPPVSIRHLKIAAGALFCYGLFAGWVVPPGDVFLSEIVNYTTFTHIAGFPVQILRSLCALTAAYSTIRMLGIFDWETQEELRKSRDRLEVRVRERTADLEAANAALAFEIRARRQAEEQIKTSNARYRDLFENANDMIQSVDAKGRYLYVNQSWLKTLGYTSDEVGKLRFTDVIHPSERPHCMGIFETLMQGEEVDRIETTFVTKSGEEVQVEGNINAQFQEGRFVATRGIFRNITQRREGEALIKGILESVGEGFVVVDPEYRIRAANWAYCGQVKQPIEEIVGKHCYEVSHRIHEPCHLAGEDCAVRRTFETGEPHRVLHTHWDSKGNPVYVELSSYPMKDRAGRTVSVIENMRDITEKKRLEEALFQAQKMEAVGQLAGGVAHDFNNILTAVTGYADLLRMELEEDEILRDHAEEILKAADKASHLTQSLLSFSRKQVLDIKPTGLNEILRKLQKFLSRIIGEDVVLDLDLWDEELTVLADRGQIEQVLMNLATNARDAMPQGGHLTIRTAAQEMDHILSLELGYQGSEKHAKISVSDTGAGMEEETLQKIFDPFFTTKETGKGTGLGLSIAYGVILQHRGLMRALSVPGQGTTFEIYLPLVDLEPEVETPRESGRPEAGSGTILLAEDNEGARNLMRKVLEKAGYRVLTAMDGEEAVERFRTAPESLDLVILDVVMPKKNGKEVYDEIRGLRPEIPTLFISGYTAEIIHARGVRDKHLEYLSKPVHPGDLLRKVKEVMSRPAVS